MKNDPQAQAKTSHHCVTPVWVYDVYLKMLALLFITRNKSTVEEQIYILELVKTDLKRNLMNIYFKFKTHISRYFSKDFLITILLIFSVITF